MNAPICKQCGETMVLRTKEGQKFWGCPNWKKCGGRTVPYIDEQQETMADYDQGKQILEKLDAIDKRITEMAKWLAGKI